MNQSNQTTLAAYNAHVQDYIDGTSKEVSDDVKTWIDASLDGLTVDARIFEVGSAFGRDADYIESEGYRVERSDASEGFVAHLKQDGHAVTLFNAITDEFPKRYDLIFANAVLLHLNRDETRSLVVKVYRNLLSAGRFSFSLKQGRGEEWSDHKLGSPRFFCYWESTEIRELLKTAGFEDIRIIDSIDSKGTSWFFVIAQKSISQ